MNRTVTAPHGSYSGQKCPACPVVVQPATGQRGERLGLREALQQHWIVCHPDHPFPEGRGRVR